jgi:hypothetical protein
MVAMKLIPQLLCWIGVALVLLRGFSGQRRTATAAACTGFALGAAGALALFRFLPAELCFGLIRDLVGGSFLLACGVSVAALYRSTGRDAPIARGERIAQSAGFAAASTLAAGMVAGAVCACRLPVSGANLLAFLLLALAGVLLTFAARALERVVPASFTLTLPGLLVLVVALLLFGSSSIIRLDLFAPLTMKVMKFTHDFVHQFFESMLIPDHLFIRPYLWGYIGLLFGKEVGFWGGLVIWFIPTLLVVLAIQFERLPQVSQIRQGAARRRVTAAGIRARRFRLVVPVLAMVILAGAVYRSRYPSVEYWDPKPMPILAGPTGEIFIPRKGEVNLDDGQLHKYLFKQGGREARFFVLMGPAGKLTVDLDACAICKPDGYGQAEGTVICYYCKTLIPLDTVGKPGGCNPVPVPFTEKEDGVHLDGLTLINTWRGTIQTSVRVKEGGK